MIRFFYICKKEIMKRNSSTKAPPRVSSEIWPVLRDKPSRQSSSVKSVSVQDYQQVKKSKQKNTQKLRRFQKRGRYEERKFQLYIISYFINKYKDNSICLVNFEHFWDSETGLQFHYHEATKRGKLYNVNDKFWESLGACKRARLIFFPLSLFLYNKDGTIDGHANILLVNVPKKQLIRFEPHGEFFDEEPIESALNRAIFDDLFNVDFFDTYLPPLNICPYVKTLQGLEELDIDEQYFIKTRGLCLIWSMWFVELMMKQPKKDPQKIIEYMAQETDKHGIRVSSKIRMYLFHLMNVYDQMSVEYEKKSKWNYKRFLTTMSILSGVSYLIYNLI